MVSFSQRTAHVCAPSHKHTVPSSLAHPEGDAVVANNLTILGPSAWLPADNHSPPVGGLRWRTGKGYVGRTRYSQISSQVLRPKSEFGPNADAAGHPDRDFPGAPAVATAENECDQAGSDRFGAPLVSLQDGPRVLPKRRMSQMMKPRSATVERAMIKARCVHNPQNPDLGFGRAVVATVCGV